MSLFIAAIGARLTSYRVDATAGTLTPLAGWEAPAPVQYAWRHPRLPLLYVACSTGLAPGGRHAVVTLRMAPDGGLSPEFAEVALSHRPIHASLTPDGAALLVAYNAPSALTVHALGADGAPGPAAPQAGPVATAVFAHQVIATPDGRTVLLVCRGNDATATAPEDPGALIAFRLEGTRLGDAQVVGPPGGRGFGPRHVAVHPNGRWIYASVELQNRLQMFALEDGRLAPAPEADLSTLAQPDGPHARTQAAGAIHLSADGRFAYVSNRTQSPMDATGHAVVAGGENSIAVFALDAGTSRPALVQSVDVQGFHPRTFGIDPTGTLLVSAAIAPMRRADGGTEPAGLTLFRIQADGTLAFLRRHALETRGATLFWSGFVGG